MDNSLEEAKLKRAIQIIKEAIGEKDAAKLEARLSRNGGQGLGLPSTLSARDRALVAPFINNPEMLRNMLNSPKGKEALRTILNMNF